MLYGLEKVFFSSLLLLSSTGRPANFEALFGTYHFLRHTRVAPSFLSYHTSGFLFSFESVILCLTNHSMHEQWDVRVLHEDAGGSL